MADDEPAAAALVNDEEAACKRDGKPFDAEEFAENFQYSANRELLLRLAQVRREERNAIARFFEATGCLPPPTPAVAAAPPAVPAQDKPPLPRASAAPAAAPEAVSPSAIGPGPAPAVASAVASGPRSQPQGNGLPASSAMASAGVSSGVGVGVGLGLGVGVGAGVDVGKGPSPGSRPRNAYAVFFRTRSQWVMNQCFGAREVDLRSAVRAVFPRCLLAHAKRQERVFKAVGEDPAAKKDNTSSSGAGGGSRYPFTVADADGVLQHALGAVVKHIPFATAKGARQALCEQSARTGRVGDEKIYAAASDSEVHNFVYSKLALRSFFLPHEDRSDPFGVYTLELFGEFDSFWLAVDTSTGATGASAPSVVAISESTVIELGGVWYQPNDNASEGALYTFAEANAMPWIAADKPAPAPINPANRSEITAEDRWYLERAEWHKTLRFLHQFEKSDHQPTLLRTDVVHFASKRLHVRDIYSGLLDEKGQRTRLLKGMESWLDSFLTLKSKPSRGLCLFGPPGTGKTTLLQELLPLCGFSSATGATVLSCSDFSGGLVGSTERNIRAVFSRGWITPYLPVVIVIDEIDGLCPDREKMEGEHGKSMVNTVLTFFQGGPDTDKNVIVASATNFLHKMDKACDRRLQTKVFVGLPSPSGRDNKIRGCTRVGHFVARNFTTNFSGANMEKLVRELRTVVRVSRLRTVADSPMRGRAPVPLQFGPEATDEQLFATVTLEEFSDACERVCKEEGITLGPFTFPSLLGCPDSYLSVTGMRELKTFADSKNHTPLRAVAARHSPPRMTGTILVNDSQAAFEVRMINSTNTAFVQVLDRSNAPMSSTPMQQVLKTVTALCSERSYFAVRLVSTSMFYSKNVREEMDMIAFLTDMMRELQEYPSWVVVIDLDSLAIPQTSVGAPKPDEPVGVANERLIRYIFEIALRQAKMTETDSHIFVLFASDPRIVGRFKKDTCWPQSDRERQKEKEDMEYRACVYCHRKYQNRENRDDQKACHHHPSDAMLRNFKDESKGAPRSLTLLLSQWNLSDATKNPEKFSNWTWTCCAKPFEYSPELGVQNGCRDGIHKPLFQRPGIGGRAMAGRAVGVGGVGGGGLAELLNPANNPKPLVSLAPAAADAKAPRAAAAAGAGAGAAAAAGGGASAYQPQPLRLSDTPKAKPKPAAAPAASAPQPPPPGYQPQPLVLQPNKPPNANANANANAGRANGRTPDQVPPPPSRPPPSAAAAPAGTPSAVGGDVKGGDLKAPAPVESNDDDVQMYECMDCGQVIPVVFEMQHNRECMTAIRDREANERAATSAHEVQSCPNCGLVYDTTDSAAWWRHIPTCRRPSPNTTK